MSTAKFRPEVFEVSTLAQAKEIIATPVPGASTDQRWEIETRFLVDDIIAQLQLTAQSSVLDYGCGIGRVARGLIERCGCRVFGVDISNSMRLMAPDYVLSDRFIPWSPQTLDKMVEKGFQTDSAISIWVIQHALNAAEVIERIHRTIRPGGLLYALNVLERKVPTDRGWIDDGFNLRAGLARVFREESCRALPVEATTPEVSACSIIQVLRKTMGESR